MKITNYFSIVTFDKNYGFHACFSTGKKCFSLFQYPKGKWQFKIYIKEVNYETEKTNQLSSD